MTEMTVNSQRDLPSRLPDDVIEALFLLVTAAVGFFLNVIVIAYLVGVRSLRTTSSVFVVHGCLLDAVKCLYSVPFATSLLGQGPPDSCAVLGGSFVVLVTASAVNIVATVCSEAYSFRLALPYSAFTAHNFHCRLSTVITVYNRDVATFCFAVSFSLSTI